MSKKYANWIKNNIKELLIDVSNKIWEFAELGLQEYKSAKLLVKVLKDHGFSVQEGVADMPTAFVATYGKGKPVIAILGEYDALPGLSQEASPVRKVLKQDAPGHGCGHNLLGVGSLGGALAVKNAIDAGEAKGTIRYYGCPAEETFNSKGYMIAPGGLFEDVDISMTWHPGFITYLNEMSALAMNSVVFKYYGRTAHAAADPQNGRSALDAVELMNIGVNYLREHVIRDARLHYVITKGGVAPNVVPAEAEVWYYIRAPERHQVDELYERVIKIAEGAALMTETRLEIEFLSGMYNTRHNETVGEVIRDKMKRIRAPQFDKDDIEFALELKKSIPENAMEGFKRFISLEMKDIAEKVLNEPINNIVLPSLGKGKVGPGSTDVADVSWYTPLAEFSATCSIMGSPGHSWQNVATSGMSIGHKGMLMAAKVLALSAIEFMNNPELVEKARKEFDEQVKDKQYKTPLPEGLKPPHHRIKQKNIE